MRIMEPFRGGAVWKSPEQCGLGFGGCLQFDGVDDYVQAEDNNSLSLNTISVFGWIRLNSIPSSGTTYYLLKKHSEYYVEITPTEYAIYVVNQAGSQGNVVGGKLKKENWIHSGFTWDNNNIRLYINGEEINRVSHSGTSVQNTGNPVQIGVGFNDLFDGLIDEVAIYNQALSLSQIQQLYAQGLPRHQLARK